MKITKEMGHACVDFINNTAINDNWWCFGEVELRALGQMGLWSGNPADTIGTGSLKESHDTIALALCMAATIAGVI